LKTELKRIFDQGLLLSSYNIYSQFRPWQMGAFILELVALEIAYHARGLTNYERTKRWTELIWDVDELKRIMTEDKLHNNPMCRKFLLALEKQDKVAPRTGVRQIIRIYMKEGQKITPQHRERGRLQLQEQGQRQSLQWQQALERTDEEHKVQRMEEVLQLGPAEGFMEELLGAEPLGYNLGYTGADGMLLSTRTQSDY
jgi:hypothetical protein